MTAQNYIDIVFDGPPSHESGRFVEVEDANGASIRVGEWVERSDGYWALRLPHADDRNVREAYQRLRLHAAAMLDVALADGSESRALGARDLMSDINLLHHGTRESA